MKKTYITAHAGCEGTPDDSVESVKCGIELKTDCVEVDVRMDGEGVLRLSHNKRESYVDADTLEEAFHLIHDVDIGINCDLKERSAFYPVLALAKKCGIPRQKLIFSGSVTCELLASDPDVLQNCRIFLNIEEVAKYLFLAEEENAAGLLAKPAGIVAQKYASLSMEKLEKIIRIAKAVGAECMNMPYKYITIEQLAFFHEQRMPVSLWTINDPEEQKLYLREDLLNVTTKAPRAALAARAESPF